MSDAIIHHINVSYDESHQRVKDFVKYLQGDERSEEMHSYYEQVKRGGKNGDYKMHLNDRYGNEFTLVYVSEHNCTLRLRGT